MSPQDHQPHWLHPHPVRAYVERARLQADRHQFEQAVKCYRQALQLRAGDPAVLGNELGNVLMRCGRPVEAEASFREAICDNGQLAALHNNLGLALKEQHKFGEAVESFQRALQLLPRSADVYCNLADSFTEQGELDKAASACANALAIDSRHLGALMNLGNVLMRQLRTAAALQCYREVVRIDPCFSQGHNNLGTALLALGRPEAALESFGRSLQVDPDHAEAHDNRALTQLLLGDFERGWREYEWRWARRGAQKPKTELPEWSGESLTGKTVLVSAEQGVGDELMFASCYEDLISRAGHCVIACDDRLASLFCRSFSSATVIGTSILAADGLPVPVDCWIPAGSVPRYLRRCAADFPRMERFLVVDSDVRALWCERLALLGEGLKIGISWKGGADPVHAAHRCTQLRQWEAVFAVPGTVFVNLQYGDCTEELDRFHSETGSTIHSFSEIDPLKELEGIAALVSALDLVISIDNSTVHLAGSLGIPTWVALPSYVEWRWGCAGNRTVWYGSVELFRQASAGRWEDVFAGLAVRLDAAAQRAASSPLQRGALAREWGSWSTAR